MNTEEKFRFSIQFLVGNA